MLFERSLYTRQPAKHDIHGSHFVLRTTLEAENDHDPHFADEMTLQSYTRESQWQTSKHMFSTTVMWTHCCLVAQPHQELA